MAGCVGCGRKRSPSYSQFTGMGVSLEDRKRDRFQEEENRFHFGTIDFVAMPAEGTSNWRSPEGHQDTGV